MLNAHATILVDADRGIVFAKNPQWIDGHLLVLDVHDRSVKSIDPAGMIQTVKPLSFLPGCFEALADGSLVVGDARRRKLHFCERDCESQVVDVSADIVTWLSDSVCDNRGGMYIGDVGFDFLNPSVEPVPHGLIVYINAAGESSVVAADLFSPQSMIVTPDNSTLIVAETLGHRLTAFEIGLCGSLSNRRVLVEFEDAVSPSGITLDSEGAVWTTGPGASAWRLKEGATVDQVISTERPVRDLVLGGPERKHLFMCTSASSDPVITRRTPNASIEVFEVSIPGSVRNQS